MGQQSPQTGALEVAVFDVRRWADRAIPARAPEGGWRVGRHVASLAPREPVGCRCNGLQLRSPEDARAPLGSPQAHRVHTGCPAVPWPAGPYHHNKADARNQTSPAGRPARDAWRQGPAQRRARPAGKRSWTGTVPFRCDATQTHSCAPVRTAQGRASVLSWDR